MKDVLKNLIVEKIKGNSNQEITGQSLQDVLLSIVDSVYGDLEISMEGYLFEGIATVATIPPTLTSDSDKRFYLAVDDGIYSNFTGLQSTPIVELSILRSTSRNYWEAISLKIPLNFSIKNELGTSQKDPISQKKVTELYNQGYKYAGIAHTVDRPNPLTGEEKIFMLVTEEGDYTNYGLGTISELSVIKSLSGSWVVEELGVLFDKTIVRAELAQGYYNTNIAAVRFVSDTSYRCAIVEVEAGNTIESNSAWSGTPAVANAYLDNSNNIIEKITGQYMTSIDITTDMVDRGVRKVLIQFYNNWDENSYVILKKVKRELPSYKEGKYLKVENNKPVWTDIDLREWKDKTIVCFGDSNTEFSGSDGKTYADHIADITGATVINVGIGGTRYGQRTTPVLNPTDSVEGYAGLDISSLVSAACNINQYRDIVYNASLWVKDNANDDNTAIVDRLLSIDWSNVHAVTFLAGTNDTNRSIIDNPNSRYDPKYLLSAIRYIIKNISEIYPHINMYFFDMLVRWRIPSAENQWGDESYWCDNYVYPDLQLTLRDIADEICETVKEYHIPVCSVYNSLGINQWNFGNYFSATDGTHLNANGKKLLATKMVSFINANKTF